VFDVSFGELLVFGVAALLVLGPHKLPGMLRLAGQWMAKGRRFMMHVRQQTGLDEMLGAQGIGAGPTDVGSTMRGRSASVRAVSEQPLGADTFVFDVGREYPGEGPDAYCALPEDLVAIAGPESPGDAANPKH
jgi:Tat protein translocase TatB subunit